MIENEKPMQAIVTSGKDVDHHELLNYYRLKKILVHFAIFWGAGVLYFFKAEIN